MKKAWQVFVYFIVPLAMCIGLIHEALYVTEDRTDKIILLTLSWIVMTLQGIEDRIKK